jgi:hypothetical protein
VSVNPVKFGGGPITRAVERRFLTTPYHHPIPSYASIAHIPDALALGGSDAAAFFESSIFEASGTIPERGIDAEGRRSDMAERNARDVLTVPELCLRSRCEAGAASGGGPFTRFDFPPAEE